MLCTECDSRAPSAHARTVNAAPRAMTDTALHAGPRVMRQGGDSRRTHCPVRRHYRSLAHCIKRRVTQVAAHGADVQRCNIDQGTLFCIFEVVLVGKAGSLSAHLTEILEQASSHHGASGECNHGQMTDVTARHSRISMPTSGPARYARARAWCTGTAESQASASHCSPLIATCLNT